MTEFVEQCRKEWSRLGVPASLADEMATDLESDLRDAGAEGVTAEELLGGSYADPRGFAASWAAERGIVPEPSSREGAHRRPRVLVAFTALAATALAVAAALLATGEPSLGITTSGRRPPGFPAPPAGTGKHVLRASAAAPIEWILLVLALAALAFAAWLWSGWARSRPSGIAALRRG
jgi:hypothetical protein